MFLVTWNGPVGWGGAIATAVENHGRCVNLVPKLAVDAGPGGWQTNLREDRMFLMSGRVRHFRPKGEGSGDKG